MRARTSLLLVSLLALPGATSAQLVRGRVLEAAADRPIPLATLELLDDRDRVLVETLSDSTGGFRIRAWQAGKYRLRAGGLSYRTVTSELMELATGEEFVLEIRLAADAIPLEPITVVARSQSSLTDIALQGYYGRRDSFGRMGIGRFYDRGEIRERGTRLTDVLRSVPGLRVTSVGFGSDVITVSGNSAFSLRGSGICQVNLYLDGVFLPMDFFSSVDHIAPIETVEAIEVYRRPAEMPAEFLSSGACGVVAIWTRRD
jgi:hypothetical protein